MTTPAFPLGVPRSVSALLPLSAKWWQDNRRTFRLKGRQMSVPRDEKPRSADDSGIQDTVDRKEGEQEQLNLLDVYTRAQFEALKLLYGLGAITLRATGPNSWRIELGCAFWGRLSSLQEGVRPRG